MGQVWNGSQWVNRKGAPPVKDGGEVPAENEAADVAAETEAEKEAETADET